MLRMIYTLFIGVLLATFVGVGISTFYNEPEPPEYPSALKIERPGNLTEPVYLELKQTQEEYDQEEALYIAGMEHYNRNTSIIAITASILLLIVSLTLSKQLLLFADGSLLGGILTLLYGVVRGFGAGDDVFRFIVVSIGLAIALFLGYIKIVKPGHKKSYQLAT